MANSKQALRTEIWDALEETGDERFPGARGRIPNFAGREKAADRLADTELFEAADVVKINPDSPQTPVRERALERGKTLYMAVPKLNQRKCFLELDPDKMEGTPSDWSSIKGASRHGEPIHPSSMEPVDMIVTGAVGVDREGRRLGKGGGYSDLEYALLLEFDLIDREVPIVTTVHPVQELDPGRIPEERQDLSLSSYYTPDKSVSVDTLLPRPAGIEPALLDDEKIDSIPILDELITREEARQEDE